MGLRTPLRSQPVDLTGRATVARGLNSALGVAMRRLCIALVLVSAPLGCSPGNYTEGDDGGAASGGGGGGQGGSAMSCGAPTTPPIDPNSLPSCCTDGAAHCVPQSFIPPAATTVLASCQGGACVPDKFIRAGGLVAPPTCQSIGNAAGVCLSVCIPQVAMYKDILPRATCDADERCAPCVNPLNQMSSGACDIGKCSDGTGGAGGGTGGAGGGAAQCPHMGPPVIDPNTLPPCCMAGGAHCVNAALVPPAEQSQLAPCTGGFCAPDSFIASGGQFIPKTCTSLAGAEGRCLSVCITQVAQQSSFLPRNTCDASERCVPCYSPLDGMATGSCNLSCDPGPTKPPVMFRNCCSNQARCVPQSAIPMALRDNLERKDCASGNLCVPSENLDPSFQPQQCQAEGPLIGTYTGVCLSECLNFGLQGLFLDTGNCPGQKKCVPCRNPLDNTPTGAPGCPP
jgi:hypothetical protein